MYLLDSDIIIDFLHGHKDATSLIGKLANKQLATSVICIAEILEGIHFSEKNKSQKIKDFKQFTKNLNVIEVEMAVASQFALLRGGLRKKGLLIDNFDLLIASTAITHNLILVTNNKKHFQIIPNLKLYK